MPDLGDALLSPFAAAGNEGIRGYINVRSRRVFMLQPGQIPGLKRALYGDDSLGNRGPRNTTKDDGNRLVRPEGSSQEFASNPGIDLRFMLHSPPPVRVR